MSWQSGTDAAEPHADAVAIGEGVQLWPRILRDVERRALQPVYTGDYRRPYREDPTPARALLPRDQYLTTTSLIATRGCHNRCDFCYLYKKSNLIWHALIRHRLTARVWRPLVDLIDNPSLTERSSGGHRCPPVAKRAKKGGGRLRGFPAAGREVFGRWLRRPCSTAAVGRGGRFAPGRVGRA
jgi:hypothetical protein